MSTIEKTKDVSFYLTIVAGKTGFINRFTYGLVVNDKRFQTARDVIECKIKFDDDSYDIILTEFFTADEYNKFKQKVDTLRSIDDCIYSPELSVVYDEINDKDDDQC